ncbi:MAG: response regulator, partial [Deltaproteobacteria bacterium]|nr:response regulator [Deltaproteobacteria bacterium]
THYRDLLLTEKKLKESQAQWENIFQAIGHPVFILAPDQTILAVNQAWEKLSGRPGKDIVGRKCYEVTHNSPAPPSLCPFAKARRSKKVETMEMEIEAVNRHFLASYTPVLTEDGSLEKVILIATDITQAKEAEAEKTLLEQQLLQAQKMEAVGTLAGGIAHDFNNILSPIIGYTELALRSLDPEQPLAAQLTQILVAGQRAKELVKQILTFSQQSLAERMPLEIQPIIKETIKLIRSSLPTTIEIRQNIATDCGTVLADPTQIHQILMNLCINAYHAMKKKPTGVLDITLAPLSLNKAEAQATLPGMQPGSYILLEIADTGCGMDLATRAKIFAPYFTTKGKTGGGTGLGLALVHGIMKAYGGYIKVESEPGKGSSFRLYFPMAEKEPMPGETELKEMLPRGNMERILVVDDEPVIMEMERILLEGLGYTVTGFCAPEEAVQAFRTRPDDFDLIITDMAMPGMSGLELTKEMKALRPEIPIILSTGFSEWINEENAKKQGICKYLMKPTLTKDLAVAVREGLEGR